MCTVCGKAQDASNDYYKSYSFLFKHHGRISACKTCVIIFFQDKTSKHLDPYMAAYHTCRLFDVYWNAELFNSATEQSQQYDSNPMQIYFQKVNSLIQYASLTFADTIDAERLDSVRMSLMSVSKPTNDTTNISSEISIDNDKNKRDVLKILGYDPFESENDLDKKHLYNTLVDFLDESTLEDPFKLAAVIEIVKSFGQIDKINRVIATVTADPHNISSQIAALKSLIDTKEKLTKAVLGFAKDNGISVNHNNTKSKGAGTLSGIIKQLQERGFDESDVNLFDIETAKGIAQVANLSNQAIRLQLNFDENDYTDMINQQRELIREQGGRILMLEEDLRRTKISTVSHGGAND